MRNYYIYGGKIHTMSQSGTVEAMLVIGDRIAMMGSKDQIEPYLPPRTEKIDLKGRAVVPGFHDSHNHLAMYSVARKQIDLMGVGTIEEALEIIGAAASKIKQGEWIVGRGWDKSLWARFPTKEQLDSVAPDNPVILSSKCGHSTWVNSAALKIAGVDRDTVAPPGGAILKDECGEPTGILQDTASKLVRAFAPQNTPEFVLEAVADCIPHLWEMGLTCIHAPDPSPTFRIARELRIERDLPLRIALMPPIGDVPLLESYGLAQGYGDDWVWTGQVKMFKDGSLGASTALLFEPYEHRPDTTGLEVLSDEQLEAHVRRCISAGYGVGIHAIGDKAVANTLDVLESCRTESIQAGVRHRIEHAQYIRPQDIQRFNKLQVIASIQPAHIVADRYMSDRELGTRSEMAFPLTSLLDSDVVLAFGSDAPVDTPDPIYGIHCAVNRKLPGDAESWYPAQCISVYDAVKAYTKDAAYAAGKEDVIGDLSQGKLADFVILSHDLFEVDKEDIASVKAEGVCIAGRFVVQPE